MIPEFCTLRAFDSDMLGRPVWYLDDPDKAAEAARAARDADVGLLFHRGPASLGEALLEAGFRHVETLVTLEMDIPSVSSPHGSDCRKATVDDAGSVEAVARASFRSDRWHTDPAIPDDKADDFKGTWARNDVAGRADATLVTLTPDGSISGFVALLARGEALIIDLIAVAPTHQGRGLGRALVAAALAYGAGRYRRMNVGTQAANTASIRLYTAMGFAEASRAETWHWTPDG